MRKIEKRDKRKSVKVWFERVRRCVFFVFSKKHTLKIFVKNKIYQIKHIGKLGKQIRTAESKPPAFTYGLYL